MVASPELGELRRAGCLEEREVKRIVGKGVSMVLTIVRMLIDIDWTSRPYCSHVVFVLRQVKDDD